ncbi:nucleosome assembly protein [Gregarina niphandrodes]|uniref:Nucleosome assembly protein n=1 Tax=Gregarina niphandrodes TaxID=110365 RepID=A0A023B2B3_GRENI|nr:nucleosome assembly protein [Gregarina niphandrodes]EZG51715.1 nucleosome assembly protein [Gregarina niphandrodes]|eukprot:XP_011131928.1 nucleosome assembly protein [Gregarina niphandrodes]
MAKRGAEEQSVSKKARVEEDAMEQAVAKLGELRDGLAGFATEVDAVDLKISAAHALLMHQHWPELKAIYARRDALIEKEEGVWGRLICSHPVTMMGLVAPIEVKFLCDYLQRVELNDYLDAHGSYELVFHFKPEASKLVEPTTWRKKVVIKEDLETVDEEKTEVTQLVFKDDSWNPVNNAAELRAEHKSENADEEDLPVFCLANWFSKKNAAEAGEFGEVFRKDLYPNPEEIISAMLDGDHEESSEDDDEDDEEENAAQENAEE